MPNILLGILNCEKVDGIWCYYNPVDSFSVILEQLKNLFPNENQVSTLIHGGAVASLSSFDTLVRASEATNANDCITWHDAISFADAEDFHCMKSDRHYLFHAGKWLDMESITDKGLVCYKKDKIFVAQQIEHLNMFTIEMLKKHWCSIDKLEYLLQRGGIKQLGIHVSDSDFLKSSITNTFSFQHILDKKQPIYVFEEGKGWDFIPNASLSESFLNIDNGLGIIFDF